MANWNRVKRSRSSINNYNVPGGGEIVEWVEHLPSMWLTQVWSLVSIWSPDHCQKKFLIAELRVTPEHGLVWSKRKTKLQCSRNKLKLLNSFFGGEMQYPVVLRLYAQGTTGSVKENQGWQHAWPDAIPPVLFPWLKWKLLKTNLYVVLY